MAETKQHYLWACLHEYRQAAMVKYRRDFNCPAIEDHVSQLGLAAKRTICYTDLLFFRDEVLWPFEKFPSLPPEEKICAALQGKTFDFGELPKNETKLIRELLNVVRSIDLVSKIVWWDLKTVRDNFFHKGVEPKEKMTSLIEEVNKLEQDLRHPSTRVP